MPITPKTGSLFHAETQNVHHERVCAMQRHTLSVTRIQSHEGFTAHELCWPARKSIPKLEHRIGSDRVEVVITVNKACQALPDDVKERIERGKRSIGRVTHRSTPVFGTPTLTARAVSSCQHAPRCNSGRGTQRTWVGNPPPETFGERLPAGMARRRHMGLRGVSARAPSVRF